MKKLPYVRKREILEMLKENEFINIDELSKKFDVSYMTINRDLRELEEGGVVSRIYGGVKAVPQQDPILNKSQVTGSENVKLVKSNINNDSLVDLPIEERFDQELSFKQTIADKAASIIQDGDVIALDPSTTTLQLCSSLQDRNIVVVTPSLNVALQFSNSKSVQIIMPGGTIRKSSLSMVGWHMNELLKWLVIDKCFLSSHAFSFDKGLTDLTLEESEAKRNLLNHSKETYVLVDHTKIAKEASFVVCNYKNINTIFTDEKKHMDEKQQECLSKYEENGVKVVYSME